jgi:hypothetical protein
MFVVFSVIPLLGGRSTRNIICIVHVIYIVSTLSEGAKQHLLIKRLYRNVPKNLVNIERKWIVILVQWREWVPLKSISLTNTVAIL